MKIAAFKSIVITVLLIFFSISVIAKETKKEERDRATDKKQKEAVTDGSNPTTETSTAKSENVAEKSLSTTSSSWQSMTMGGGNGSSARFGLSSSVGQSLSGTGTSSALMLSSSFFQNFSLGPVSCCIGDRGNIDSDPNDIFDISDVVYLINWLFNDGPGPICKDEANVVIEDPDIADLVYFISYMFANGPAPPACNESPVI